MLPRWWSTIPWHHLLRLASLLAVAAGLGLALVRDQEEAIPVALAGLAVGWFVTWRSYRGDERSFLLTLFLVALSLRVVAAVLIHPFLEFRLVTSGRDVTYVGIMFADDRVYDNVAWALARTWAGVIEGVARDDGYLLNNYTYSVGLLYYLLGHELMAAKVLVCILGALLPAASFSLAKELGGAGVGRFVALLTAFFPSLVLWSVLNLKDIPIVLLLTLAMLGALRFGRRPTLAVAVATLIAFALLENLRLYVFFAFGWLIPLTFFVSNRAPWRRRLAIGVPFTIAILGVVFLTNQSQWLGLRYLTDKRQEALASSREFGSASAATGIEFDNVPRSAGGWGVQLVNAPRVLPYVLFAPFPWAARTAREVAVIPETLLWYGVEAAVVLALVVYGRRRWREFFLPVVYAAGLIAIGTLIEGNVGTIYRHRAMLMPPAFALAGVGLAWLYGRWMERRAVGPIGAQADSTAGAQRATAGNPNNRSEAVV